MAYHPKVWTQNCPKCGKQLISVSTLMIELGSPLIMCPRCGKTNYTKLRREWYNYPDKDVLWLIPLVLTIGIGGLIDYEFETPGLLVCVPIILLAIIFGGVMMVRIAGSKKRMRDPEYLAELLRWRIIRQGEYEEFMRNAQQKKG